MRRDLPTTLISAVVVGAVGCNPSGLDDSRHPTGSQTMVASSDYQALYVANVDHGTISRVDPFASSAREFEAGREPTRIARAGERVFVTLRGERAVAVFNENGDSLSFETKIEVGAEPFGVVASEKGDRIYVASSLSYRVDEIDAEGLTILRSFSMPAEPRWLALHPSNKTLYVGSPFSRDLIYVNLESGSIATTPLPEGSSFTSTGFGTTTTPVPLTPRITGDMSVSPRGYEVAIPTLYGDNGTPIDDTIPPPAQGYYGGPAGVAGGGGRLTPVLAILPVSNEGEPLADYGFALMITSRDFNGYPASAVFDPESTTVFTPIESGGGIIATSIDNGSEKDDNALAKVFAGDSSQFGFPVNPIQTIGNTGAGPRSVVFLEEDRAFSHAFIDNKIADVLAGSVKKSLASETALFGGNLIDARSNSKPTESEALPPQIAAGRRLFYASNDPRISSSFSGLSCSTCHFDGRNDGLTWTFTKGQRQTPSLAGNISVTNPVRWEGDRETVQIDAMRTAKDAMGGGGLGGDLSAEDLDAIAAFVDSTRDVMVPVDTLDQEAVARGREIFNRTDVGCATCHVGERYTNNKLYSMFGMSSVKTRPLTGVAATAPYLHDGSAETLMDVLLRSRDGSMGNTSMLSDREMVDLEQYLRSL